MLNLGLPSGVSSAKLSSPSYSLFLWLEHGENFGALAIDMESSANAFYIILTLN